MRMRSLIWVRLITVMAIVVLGVPSVYASGSDLVSQLVGPLGVTPEQATGGGLASLAGSFKSLGLSPDMAGKFAKEALSYVQSSGGDAAMKLLEGALK